MRPRSRPGWRAAGPAAALLAACTFNPSLQEFDALARTSEARTIVLEPGLSLYSPFDPSGTRGYLELIEEQRAAVFELFGVESADPLIVYLRPNEGMGLDLSSDGEELRVEGVRSLPDGSVLGQAGERVIVVEVAAPQEIELWPGRTVIGAMDPAMCRDTVRHELAHVASNLLGVRGADWLKEGLAHAVEWIPLEGQAFVLEPTPKLLRAAAAASPRESRSLEWLLAWDQAYPSTPRDALARQLGLSLVLFLLEREDAPTLREGCLRLAALEPRAVLALEREWSAWLDRHAGL